MHVLEPLLLTEPEVMLLTHLSKTSIWRLRRSGELRCLKVGRSVRYSRADVLAWIARGLEDPSASTYDDFLRAQETIDARK